MCSLKKVERIVAVCTDIAESEPAAASYQVKFDNERRGEDLPWLFASDFSSTVDLRSFWRILDSCTEMSEKERDIANYLLVIHELQQERFRFYFDERVIFKDDWYNFLCFGLTNSFVPSCRYFSFKGTLKRFCTQMNAIATKGTMYPHIEIENSVDLSLPLTWKNTVFRFTHPKERIPSMTTEEGSCDLILTKLGLGNALMQQEVINSNRDPNTIPGFMKLTVDESREVVAYYKALQHLSPVTSYRLLLKRNSTMHVWELSLKSPIIDKDRIIMPLTGVIRESSAAKKFCKRFGEVFAFGSFIKLPDELCVDRSTHFGVDKYIAHSCDPNCCIKLIPVDECSWPLAFVVAKRTIREGEVLTLNYFYHFPSKLEKIDQHELHMTWIAPGTQRNHVVCYCNSPNCGDLLWYAPASEEEKERSGPFCGMALDTTGL